MISELKKGRPNPTDNIGLYRYLFSLLNNFYSQNHLLEIFFTIAKAILRKNEVYFYLIFDF